MLNQPMSSPHMMRMLGFFAAMSRSSQFSVTLNFNERAACSIAPVLSRLGAHRFAPPFVRSAIAVAEAELLAATAGAGLIRSALRVSGGDRRHNFRGRVAPLDQLGHRAEGRARMHEKQFEARTQVILARLAVARKCEAVLRAAAVAPIPHLAAAALGRERFALVLAELALLRRGHELQHVRFMDVAELETRLHEMIAGVYIAVVLERRTVAAGGRMDAQ